MCDSKNDLMHPNHDDISLCLNSHVKCNNNKQSEVVASKNEDDTTLLCAAIVFAAIC